MRNTGRAKEGWRGRNTGEERTNTNTRSLLEKNSSTFFFSNFPDSHGEYEMFRVRNCLGFSRNGQE